MRRRLSNWLPLLLLAAARADDDDEACSGTYTLSGQDIRLKTAPLGAASPRWARMGCPRHLEA